MSQAWLTAHQLRKLSFRIEENRTRRKRPRQGHQVAAVTLGPDGRSGAQPGAPLSHHPPPPVQLSPQRLENALKLRSRPKVGSKKQDPTSASVIPGHLF